MTKAIAKQEERQLAPQQKKFFELKELLLSDKAQEGLREVAAKTITPRRITRLMLASASGNPKILECSPDTILRALLDCAKLGLTPDGRWGGAHIVPYYSKRRGRMEAQLITDWRGEIALACRGGAVLDVFPKLVYEQEVEAGRFKEIAGSNPSLVHEPLTGLESRGDVVAAYAVAVFSSGNYRRWRVLWLPELEKRRSRSQGGGTSGPWQTDTEAMYLKTAVRALCSQLPVSIEYAEWAQREEAADMDFDPGIIDVPPEGEEIAPPLSATDSLASKLRREQSARQTVEDFKDIADEALEKAPL